MEFIIYNKLICISVNSCKIVDNQLDLLLNIVTWLKKKKKKKEAVIVAYA